MKPETIKAIFTNLLFVIGVVLLIYGFSRGALTLTRLAVFPKYPLYTYEETRCELNQFSYPEPVALKERPSVPPDQIQQQKERCLEGLEMDRKNKMVEDLTSSITSLFAGALLIYFFRRFILK